jgi:hypothetical protein
VSNRRGIVVDPMVHTPGDGRGWRRVYLDGKPISHVMLADERRGYVVCAMDPVRLDKHRKRVLTCIERGNVVVEPMPAFMQDVEGRN